MAKKGLSTFLYGELKDDGSYAAPEKLAAAISFKETLTKSTGSVYADNIKQFEDNSVTGGNLALEVLDDDPAIFGPLLGRKTKTVGEKEAVVGNTNDIPMPVGFGLIEKERTGAKKLYYRVKFYPKVTFAPYDSESQTEKESPEYKNPMITGSLYCLENGDYIVELRCDTMEEAVSALYQMFGAAVPAMKTAARTDDQTTA